MLGSISGLERFGLGLNPDISGDGKVDDEGEGEENGEDVFFMMLLTELTLPRLQSREGEESSSGLKEMRGLGGLPVSGGRYAGDGCGEANGDARDFTFPRPRARVFRGQVVAVRVRRGGEWGEDWREKRRR